LPCDPLRTGRGCARLGTHTTFLTRSGWNVQTRGANHLGDSNKLMIQTPSVIGALNGRLGIPYRVAVLPVTNGTERADEDMDGRYRQWTTLDTVMIVISFVNRKAGDRFPAAVSANRLADRAGDRQEPDVAGVLDFPGWAGSKSVITVS